MSTDDPTPLDDDDMTTTSPSGPASDSGSGRDVGGSGSLDTQDEGSRSGQDSDGTDSADGVDQGPGPDSGPRDSSSADGVDQGNTGTQQGSRDSS